MITLHVPDMSCGHCKASIEAKLTPMADTVAIDLPARRVSVNGKASAEELLDALKKIGFPAEVAKE